MIYFIRFQCFVMCYISLEWYLLHCVLHNDHSLRCVDWKLTSAAPCIHKVYTWHKVSVTSHLLTLKGHMSPLCSQQWHGSWLTDLRPSKSNGKDSNFFLRVLWAHMSEYFHFMCRPLLLHRMTLVSFRLFRKYWGNLREFFWANSLPHPPPPGQKIAPIPMDLLYNTNLKVWNTQYCYKHLK